MMTAASPAVSDDMMTVFLRHVEKGHIDDVRAALEQYPGIVNQKLGLTPLQKAAAHDRAEVAAVIIEHGADIDMPTSTNCTPLILAAQAGAMEVVRLLLKNGAKADVRNSDGHTAAALARLFEHFEIAETIEQEDTSRFQQEKAQAAEACHALRRIDILRQYNVRLRLSKRPT